MRFLLLKLAEQWVQPGILKYPATEKSVYPPLGLLYLGSTLEKLGHSVRIIDLGFEHLTEEQFALQLKNTDVVGMSVYSNNYTNACEIAQIIKQSQPTIPLIIGGPHCIFSGQQALTHIPPADILVNSEGETILPYLIQALEGKKNLSKVPGISYRKKDTIKTTRSAPLNKKIDTIPFPARHLVEHYDYGNFPWGYKIRKKFTSILTSRGCAYQCRFCCRYSNVIPGFCFRQRSAENVVLELEEIKEKYRSVAIVDDNFLADKKRSHRIFDMLLERGIYLDMFIVGTRVDSADKMLYEKMKKTGVTYINYGIESGNQDVLDFYRKHITLQQTRYAIRLARQMNFFVSASFILGGPTETKIHIKNSIKFIQTLPLDVIVIRPFYYELGGDVWYDALNEGKINKDEIIVRADVNRGLGHFTEEQIDYYIKLAFRHFYLRPRYFLGQIKRSLLQKDLLRLYISLKVVSSSQMKTVL